MKPEAPDCDGFGHEPVHLDLREDSHWEQHGRDCHARPC